MSKITYYSEDYQIFPHCLNLSPRQALSSTTPSRPHALAMVLPSPDANHPNTDYVNANRGILGWGPAIIRPCTHAAGMLMSVHWRD